MTNSFIYEGHVQHRRIFPVHHAFRYSLFLLYLDLDELETVFAGRCFWSTSRTALARFCRADHLGDADIPLSTSVRDLVEAQTGHRPDGPIRLLTHLRYFGYAMNPVSFYYCFDKTGQRVETIVSEVNNTPWGEQHCYVLSRNEDAHKDRTIKTSHPKDFHVSPFMGMNQQYRWMLSEPQESLTVQIRNFEDSNQIHEATLSLKRHPITTWRLARALMRYPFMTGKVAVAIYWQALRLWWKKCPYHPHPKSLDKKKVSLS